MVGIEWDTGEGTPIFAHEDMINAVSNTIARNRLETNDGTGALTVYDDAGADFHDTAGADVVARTTAGVVEVGGGAYGVNNNSVDISNVVGIEWDTGEGTPIFAHEDMINAVSNTIARNRLETNDGTGALTVYDDAGAAVLTGDLFEDVAGTTPYAGNAVLRRERLT